MKKVICIQTQKSLTGNETVYKDRIYTVIREDIMPTTKKPGYYLGEFANLIADVTLFRDIEDKPILVTFTELVETYPVHAN